MKEKDILECEIGTPVLPQFELYNDLNQPVDYFVGKVSHVIEETIPTDFVIKLADELMSLKEFSPAQIVLHGGPILSVDFFEFHVPMLGGPRKRETEERSQEHSLMTYRDD